jgi:hypothetical protein
MAAMNQISIQAATVASALRQEGNYGLEFNALLCRFMLRISPLKANDLALSDKTHAYGWHSSIPGVTTVQL